MRRCSGFRLPASPVGLAALAVMLSMPYSVVAGGDDCTWNSTNGTWDDGARWTCGHAPGLGDTANIAAGSVTLNAAVTVAVINLSGGRILGPEDLTVTMAIIWTGGSFEATGKTIIPQGSVMTISGPNPKTFTRDTDLSGDLVWSGSGTVTLLSATLTVLPTGELDFQNDQVSGGSTFTIANSGTVTKSAGAGTTDWRGVFNQTSTGSLTVGSGTFKLFGGGSVDGTVTANGTTLEVSGFNTTFESSASFTATHLLVSGNNAANFELGGPSFNVTTAEVTAGSLRFDGPNITVPNLTLSGGTVTGSADIEVTTAMNYSAGNMSGTGKTTVAGGAMLAIMGTGTKSVTRPFENAGDATWTDAGNISINEFANASNGTLTIMNDQTWGGITFLNQGTVTKLATPGPRGGVADGGARTEIFPFFTQEAGGSLDIQSGVFRVVQGGAFDGMITATGSTLEFQSSSVTFAASSTLSAQDVVTAGAVVITAAMGGPSFAVSNITLNDAGRLNCDAPMVTIPNLYLFGGTLGGSGTVEITSALDWQGGTMTDNGKTVIPDGVTATASTSGAKGIQREVEIAGSFVWTGDGTIAGNGPLINLESGSIEFQNAAQLGATAGTFTNHGSVAKSSPGETTIDFTFNQSDTGSFQVTNGSVRFRSGGLVDGEFDAADQLIHFAGVGFAFEPTVDFAVGDIEVSGVLDLSAVSNLVINNLTQTSGGLTVDNPSVTILGDFVHTGGSFQAGKGRLLFAGETTQNLTLGVDTTFFLLEVTPNTTLVETEAADRAIVDGFLRNRGTIRKTQPIPVSGSVTFGLTDIEVGIGTAGTLTSLQVDRVASDHPSWAPPAMPLQHWVMTPIGAGYTVDLILNHCIQPDAEMLLCRHTGSAWVCGNDKSDATSITRFGVTELDMWAMGAVDPFLFMSGFTCGSVAAWTDVRGLC